MPSLEYFLICSGCSQDRPTGRISIYEVLDELTPIRLPSWIPRLSAVAAWRIDPEDKEKDFQVTLKVSSNKIEMPPFRLNFKADGSRQRIIMNLVQLLITDHGVIKFEIFLNDKYEARHELLINPPDGAFLPEGIFIYPQPTSEKTEPAKQIR